MTNYRIYSQIPFILDSVPHLQTEDMSCRCEMEPLFTDHNLLTGINGFLYVLYTFIVRFWMKFSKLLNIYGFPEMRHRYCISFLMGLKFSNCDPSSSLLTPSNNRYIVLSRYALSCLSFTHIFHDYTVSDSNIDFLFPHNRQYNFLR
jgi:hypothetical protein